MTPSDQLISDSNWKPPRSWRKRWFMNRYPVAPDCTCCSITPSYIPKGLAENGSHTWVSADKNARRSRHLFISSLRAQWIGHVFGHMSTDRAKPPSPNGKSNDGELTVKQCEPGKGRIMKTAKASQKKNKWKTCHPPKNDSGRSVMGIVRRQRSVAVSKTGVERIKQRPVTAPTEWPSIMPVWDPLSGNQ